MSTKSVRTNQYDLRSTRDAGQARAWLAEHFVDHELERRMDRGRFDFIHMSTPLSVGTANILRYGAEMEIAPDRFESFYMLEMPLEGGVDVEAANSATLSSSSSQALFVPPDLKFLSRWRPGTRQFMLQLDRHQVQQRWRQLLNDPTACLPAFGSTIRFATPEGSRLREAMQILQMDFERGCRQATSSTSSLLHSPLPGKVIDLVLDYIRSHHMERVTPETRVPLPAALSRTLIFIRHNLAHNIAMRDLVAVSGVSERSLFAQFAQFLETSPMRYLEAKRLEQVRALLLSGRGVNVSAAAASAGFRHMGRFSQSYRRAYGETPSKTLAQSPAASGNAYPDPAIQ